MKKRSKVSMRSKVRGLGGIWSAYDNFKPLRLNFEWLLDCCLVTTVRLRQLMTTEGLRDVSHVWNLTTAPPFLNIPPDHLLLDSALNLGPIISCWEINKFEN
jgi:hypothetical protein